MSSSSSSRSRSPRTRIVTSVPSSWKKWPISAVTYPPPTMARRRGSSGRRMTSSEVWTVTPSIPGIGGMVGRLPAAMTIWSPSIDASPMARRCEPVKRASPLNTVMFGAWRLPSSIARASRSMSANTRSTIDGQSIRSMRASMPNRSARRIVRATSATWTSIFEGMQPRFRHVPPKGPGSMTATRRPADAAAADTSVPDPAPMTMRSKRSVGEGMGHLLGWGRVRAHHAPTSERAAVAPITLASPATNDG